jgi:hypothetical protein
MLGQVQSRSGGTLSASLSYACLYLAIHLGGYPVLACTMACLVLLAFVVVAPAVWSTRATRRLAALEVLRELLRFLRRRH